MEVVRLNIVDEKLKGSRYLGYTGHQRTLDFMLAKLMEEVGELATEVNVELGRLPQEKGSVDGVMGEAADVINCAVDIAFIYIKNQHPNLSNQQVAQMLGERGKAKSDRWINRLKLQSELKQESTFELK
ncbi:hypothetical protein [Photobacterium satsumensis]|uniref:hypothetical protein n=1 Tax=Photobacterium satsumensis TaxID=2910239 RepID=UPI003D12D9CA